LEGNPTVLLVDDEEDFMSTLVKRLRKRNLDIEGAPGGKQALECLDRRPADVVVMDVRMPGMDGIEALKRIKERFPLTEVIMLTGHADMEVAVQGMELGAFDYLMKPMDIDDLLFKIQDAFQRKSLHEAKIKNLAKGESPGLSDK
jgi:DNA-binding NtrC family response regulator